MADTPITVTRAAIGIAVPDTESIVDVGLGVTSASPSFANQTATFPRTVAITVAAASFAGSSVGLEWSGTTGVVSVNAATPSFFAYNVGGDAKVERDHADISLAGSDVTLTIAAAGAFSLSVDHAQPGFTAYDVPTYEDRFFDSAAPSLSGKSVGLVRGAGVTNASFSIAGKDVGLFVFSSQSIGVVAANITLTPQNIERSWLVSIDQASPFFVGNNIALSQTEHLQIAVNPANISFAGSSVAGNFSLAVTQAEPSFAGNDIGRGDGTTVTAAAPSIAGQDIAADRSLAVVSSAPSFVGRSITLDWTIDNGVIVVAAEPGFVGVTTGDVDFILGNTMPVTEATPSLAGSVITLAVTDNKSISVHGNNDDDTTFAELLGKEIDLILTFTLGIVVEPAQITFAGSSVFAALGSGAPTRIVSTQSSNHISMTQSAPFTTANTESERIRASG
jgi:hypothetical protein